MNLRYILLIPIFFLVVPSYAQPAGLLVSFSPRYAQQPLLLDAAPLGPDSIQFQTLRFYVSAVALYHHGQPAWQELDSYRLLDAAVPGSMRFLLSPPPGLLFDSLHFTLGIDSATNAAGAGAGELDATKGMYWAWQTGYINFKLEGVSPHCPTRRHQFFLHLGGFRGSDACAQSIVLPVYNKAAIPIAMNLDKWLTAIGFPATASLMMPGEKAVALSQQLSGIFSTQRSQ